MASLKDIKKQSGDEKRRLRSLGAKWKKTLKAQNAVPLEKRKGRGCRRTRPQGRGKTASPTGAARTGAQAQIRGGIADHLDQAQGAGAPQGDSGAEATRGGGSQGAARAGTRKRKIGAGACAPRRARGCLRTGDGSEGPTA